MRNRNVIDLDRRRLRLQRTEAAQQMLSDRDDAQFLLEHFTITLPIDIEAFAKIWRRIARRGGRFLPSDRVQIAKLMNEARRLEKAGPVDGRSFVQLELAIEPRDRGTFEADSRPLK